TGKMESVIARIRRMGGLFLVGIIVIICLALGMLYIQQGGKQTELEAQITQISTVVSRPLPSTEKLENEYKEVNSALAPVAVPTALDIIVGIAEKSGIDVSLSTGTFNIPPPDFPVQQKIGEGDYQVLSINNIKVQGSYDNVMDFLSDLDSGKTLPTMVLNKASISQIEIPYFGIEEVRRSEYHMVSAAVTTMMIDNSMWEIPEPLDLINGIAVKYMGDNPETTDTVEGFPDITTTAANKGWTGTEDPDDTTTTPRDGYVLYMHAIINPDDTTTFFNVSYIGIPTTKYYYACERNGKVTQFDGPDVVTSTRYWSTEKVKLELVVSINVSIYTTPSEGNQL
ncbi:hypothetical protein ACFLTK_02205, partial [Chloroflexota bacterium]